MQDLKDDGIKESHIYAVAGPDTAMAGLPDGGPEDDDFLPAFERGVAMGGATGMLAGLLAMAIPPAGIVVGGGAVLLFGMMGGSLGGLLTGMAGAAFPNTRLKKFEDEIQAGRILILVDVPRSKVAHVNSLILRHDPEVEIEGIEPPAPIIPK